MPNLRNTRKLSWLIVVEDALSVVVVATLLVAVCVACLIAVVGVVPPVVATV